ncbi:TIGR02444 family protein [Pseudomonas sp. GD03842]|uniref:TIGR02444 family protein n=1 Tax=unclassified Pseudomonas TaxID=196821 RepID=UPI000D34EA0F|nr:MULTISPECIES: TIGR02444 family protein [unclassified Pseudomonas]MDH0745882.1 TIGR02444 family protein [Pseudomonas sp. GD03842]RAU48687.1 TIGR02444 family protein [Pseudomonas sp. RIT 409]RAU54053.1 TIGR02444 family protein [Pseudomonas sp. RIT 412]
MPSDLWSFTLDFYARPGVEQACLALQTNGGNVCALLCGVWLDQRRIPFDPERAEEIRQLATPWHDDVVGPLRAIRTRWKAAAAADEELGALRERLKGLELDAERELLVRLQRLVQNWPRQDVQAAGAWLKALAGKAGTQSPDALQVLQRVGLDAA